MSTDPTDVSDEEYSRRHRRYWRKHSHSKLFHKDLLRADIAAHFQKDELLTNDVGKRLLSDFGERLRELSARQWKITLIGSIPIFLVFLSLKGVKWRASALGIELEDIQQIKELILLFSTLIGFYATVAAFKTYLLGEAIQAIGETMFGQEAFEIHKLALPMDDDAASYFLFPRKSVYSAGRPYLLAMLGWVLNTIIYLILLITLSIIPYAYVLHDIWTTSTWPYGLGKVAALVCLLTLSLGVLFLVAIRFLRHTFLDRNKVRELSERASRDIDSFAADVRREPLTLWDRLSIRMGGRRAGDR
jgi:hypothetical protein